MTYTAFFFSNLVVIITLGYCFISLSLTSEKVQVAASCFFSSSLRGFPNRNSEYYHVQPDYIRQWSCSIVSGI